MQKTNYKVYHYSEITLFNYSKIPILNIPGSTKFMGRKDIYIMNLSYLQNLSSFIETDESSLYFSVPELKRLLQIKQTSFKEYKPDFNENKPDNFPDFDKLILSEQKNFIISVDMSLPSINPIFYPNIALKGNARYYDQTPSNLGWYIKAGNNSRNAMVWFTNCIARYYGGI